MQYCTRKFVRYSISSPSVFRERWPVQRPRSNPAARAYCEITGVAAVRAVGFERNGQICRCQVLGGTTASKRRQGSDAEFWGTESRKRRAVSCADRDPGGVNGLERLSVSAQDEVAAAAITPGTNAVVDDGPLNQRSQPPAQAEQSCRCWPPARWSRHQRPDVGERI